MFMTDRIELRSTGTFSLAGSVNLAASAFFAEGFQHRQDDGDGSVFDFAFLLEGPWSGVAVNLAVADGRVFVSLLDNPSGAAVEAIRMKLEQILSLDVDANAFEKLARRDQVVADLLRRMPGIRPVLIPSPYESAARAMIGHRLFVRQAAAVSSRIAAEYGVSLKTTNGVFHTFPAPARLAKLSSVQGLAQQKVDQLCALGSFATDGGLDSALLRSMERDAALSYLQQLPGIGPLSAELILLRGIGDPDALPLEEKRLQRAMSEAYQLGDDPSIGTLQEIASRWQPYRELGWVAATQFRTVCRS